MSEITQLSPTAVWHFFDQICSIPHPSKYEEQLAQYIVSFAQAEGLDVRRDNTGNVIIKKPATAGMENRKGVVLQAHIDMVPQKMKTQYTTLPKIQFCHLLMVNG